MDGSQFLLSVILFQDFLIKLTDHYENMPMQYTIFLGVINIEKFHLKIFLFLFHLCSKHRLWVHVRTALSRRFKALSRQF